jgi:hypothetical protein
MIRDVSTSVDMTGADARLHARPQLRSRMTNDGRIPNYQMTVKKAITLLHDFGFVILSCFVIPAS